MRLIIELNSEVFEIVIHTWLITCGTEKLLEYNDFCKAFSIIANKEHLTEEGLLKLKGIKLGMNTSRVKSNQNILQANVFMGLCSNISLNYLFSFLREI